MQILCCAMHYLVWKGYVAESVAVVAVPAGGFERSGAGEEVLSLVSVTLHEAVCHRREYSVTARSYSSMLAVR